MKKIFTLFAIFACLPILLSAKGPAVIGGSTYTADTLSHYKVGPGTYYTAIHFYGPKDMRAFYLEIDATNPYPLADTFLFPGSGVYLDSPLAGHFLRDFFTRLILFYVSVPPIRALARAQYSAFISMPI